MKSPRRISHYELLETIGRDGATEIYRARDTRLSRDVAVKLLRPEEICHSEAVERFRREARIASVVTHPHICIVHDSGEENGRPFLVSELLEGRPLDEVMDASPLPLDRALDIALQLVDVLAAAHRRGIVHGNVKPSNVFITAEGHTKLLELGAAAAVLELQPNPSNAESGTAPYEWTKVSAEHPGEFFHPYVAPEQIEGSMDHRSDLFSVGALLYEMATGTAAFHGATPADVAASVTTQVPARPRAVNPNVPPEIERVIQRALQKDPGRRYQSAEEFREHLRQARCRFDDRARRSSRWRFGHRARQAAIYGLAVVTLVGMGTARSWWRRSVYSTVERSAILVSQIANGTGDSDFDGTLRQAVSVYLGQSPYLDLVSDERIRATLRLMGKGPDDPMTHDVAAELCQRLGLQAMLEGSVSALGPTTVIALVASDCSTGAPIARHQMEVERKEEVLRALGQLTASMRQSLGESRSMLARHNVPIEEATTPSMEALKAYTKAIARRTAGAETEAVALLERAVAIDPHFALGYTTLSSIFGGFGETGRSEKYARLAFENRFRVSERERLFIMYQYHDRVTGNQLKAREALEVWKAAYPRDYRAPNALAVLLNRIGDYAQASKEAEDALRRNPAHPFPRSNLAYAHRGAGRVTEARSVIEEALARNLETMPMRRLLYQLAELQRDGAAARRQIEWAAERPRRFDMTGAQAQVAAFRGHIREARALYEETIELATERGFPQVASGYASQVALTEALYGYTRNATMRGREVLKMATSYEPELRAAMTFALAGAPGESDAVLRRFRDIRPEDTFLQNVYLPAARAATLVARGSFDAAIDTLRHAAAYEGGTVAGLAPTYIRALAHWNRGAAGDAARGFRSVLDHRGADPFSALVPLSQLGLARALASMGAYNESRKAYEEFLRDWSSADPDLPILLQARGEYSRLR